MYTLRTITNEGVENNNSLGKNYQYVDKYKSPKEFQRLFKEVLGSSEKYHDLVYGFIVCRAGTLTLRSDEAAYVVSESGVTFKKLN